jgi:hypothetical protein
MSFGDQFDLYAGALVREYLQRRGLAKTLDVYDFERKEKGSLPSDEAETDAWYALSSTLNVDEFMRTAKLREKFGADVTFLEGVLHMLAGTGGDEAGGRARPRGRALGLGRRKATEDPLSPTAQMRRRREKQQQEKARQLLALGVDPKTGRDMLADVDSPGGPAATIREKRLQKRAQRRKTTRERAEADLATLADGGGKAGRLLGKTRSLRSELSARKEMRTSGLASRIGTKRVGSQKPSKESWIPMDVRMRSLKRGIETAKLNYEINHVQTTLIAKKREHWKNQSGQAKVRETLTTRSKKRKTCALCEMEFAEVNLPFVVSYKAVMDVRLNWGVQIPPNPKYGTFPHWYRPVKCCVFCSQFLQADGGLFDSEERGTLQKGSLGAEDQATLTSMGLTAAEYDRSVTARSRREAEERDRMKRGRRGRRGRH